MRLSGSLLAVVVVLLGAVAGLAGMEAAAQSKTPIGLAAPISFPSTAPALESVCFGDAVAAKDGKPASAPDCLDLKDLRALVADRGAAATSMAAAVQAQQTAEAFKSAYQQSQSDLGDCQTKLGPWTKISGAIAAGTSMIVDLPTLKSKIEAANPGKTIDATWKIADLPKTAEKKAGGGH